MKRISCIVLMVVTLALPALCQDRDSLLRRINQIKLDTDRYLYGLSTVPGEPAVEPSRSRAVEELKGLVDNYIDSQDGIVFLKGQKDFPEQLVEYVSCLVRPDTYRTIAYVEKSRLMELEKSMADRFGSDSRIEAMKSLVSGILGAGSIGEVLDLISSSSLAEGIQASQAIDESTQEMVNESILVYFDPRTKRVLEVMSPVEGDSFSRKNMITGAPADPLKYRNAPLWIHIEGLKTSNVL